MHLSRRQTEIVSHVAGGLSDQEIARRLGVSVATIRTRLQRLDRDNRVHSPARAAILWVESGRPVSW